MQVGKNYSYARYNDEIPLERPFILLFCFREDDILCVDDLCPEEHKQRVIFNIAEKVSLEWFGKFSTTWNAIWLKDALARYASYKIGDLVNERIYCEFRS